jgi:DMSO/TMAO reductase YedYZ molybdopterin-dependent catalytic subunit
MGVNRRKFIGFWAGASLFASQSLRSEHHVVSADPLEVIFDLDSLADRYTAAEDFYVRNHNETPPGPGGPALSIGGEVSKPCVLLPVDLGRLKKAQLGAVLECAGNPVGTRGLVSNGRWAGWPLADVLQLAHPTSAAKFLHLFGRDGYARSVPIDRAWNGAILATELDGVRLRSHHGAPWRALFPGWYGMDSIKWLERIVASPAPLRRKNREYLQVRSTASGEPSLRPLDRIEVKSVITYPTNGTVARRGNMQVRGLAWSGAGEISKVEVIRDGEKHWQRASFSPTGRYEWVLWKVRVELSQPGAAEIACRAVDTTGQTQPERRDPTRLDGYGNNWYHRVQVVLV